LRGRQGRPAAAGEAEDHPP